MADNRAGGGSHMPSRTSPPSVRVAPYPQRARTPPRSPTPSTPTSAAQELEQMWSTPQSMRLPPDPQRCRPQIRSPSPTSAFDGERRVTSFSSAPVYPDTSATPHHGLRNPYQLLVRPIVKHFVSQHETSGEMLDDFVANGSSFDEIMRVLWDRFSDSIKTRAVRVDGEWEVGSKSLAEWQFFMQFKTNKQLIRGEQDWNRWLPRHRGETVRLLIYAYGIGVATAKDRDEFEAKHITPARTDRAGAAAEVTVQDMVEQLRSRWSSVFRGHEAIWRMWANHIMRDSPFTWEAGIEATPPPYVAELLRPADSTADRHLTQIIRSAHMALDCVNGAMADFASVRDDWNNFGRRLDVYERSLESRKRIIEAMIRDAELPSADVVIDPVPLVENIDDVEHQD